MSKKVLNKLKEANAYLEKTNEKKQLKKSPRFSEDDGSGQGSKEPNSQFASKLSIRFIEEDKPRKKKKPLPF